MSRKTNDTMIALSNIVRKSRRRIPAINPSEQGMCTDIDDILKEVGT